MKKYNKKASKSINLLHKIKKLQKIQDKNTKITRAYVLVFFKTINLPSKIIHLPISYWAHTLLKSRNYSQIHENSKKQINEIKY
jgi:hypothetical protein